MSAKQHVIEFVNQKFQAHHGVRDALVQMVSACADDGKLATLRAAYEEKHPEVAITDDPNAASGAYYDNTSNRITINPRGVPLDLADMFLFESFNCAHRDEYRALTREYNNSNRWPPMYFKDYGEQWSDIEGRAVFEYITLLREIQQNKPAFHFPHQAWRSLQDNEAVGSELQLQAKMRWTPHDPAGTGDWRFPTPAHYAFRRVLDLTSGQAGPRIRYVVLKAAGTSDRAFYNQMDGNSIFWNWWGRQWQGLPQEARPTELISVFEEANRVFQGMPGIHWRRIALSDYQFDTAMELEARRLRKRSSLGHAARKW